MLVRWGCPGERILPSGPASHGRHTTLAFATRRSVCEETLAGALLVGLVRPLGRVTLIGGCQHTSAKLQRAM